MHFAIIEKFWTATTTTHGDPISAIVLGAPGHAASAATALDGYPMTKRGEGARDMFISILRYGTEWMMRLEGKKPWKITLPMAFCVTLLVYSVFDQLLTIPWPPTLLGDIFPAAKMIPSV